MRRLSLAALAMTAVACSPAPSGATAPQGDIQDAPLVTAERTTGPGAGVCARVDQSLIPQHEAELKGWIEAEVGREAGPVTVQRRMEVGDWLAVWATPDDREQGVYFIRRTDAGPRFYEPWGGMAEPEDRAEIAGWARDLDPEMPAALADCFAQEITRPAG